MKIKIVPNFKNVYKIGFPLCIAAVVAPSKSSLGAFTRHYQRAKQPGKKEQATSPLPSLLITTLSDLSSHSYHHYSVHTCSDLFGKGIFFWEMTVGSAKKKTVLYQKNEFCALAWYTTIYEAGRQIGSFKREQVRGICFLFFFLICVLHGTEKRVDQINMKVGLFSQN